MGKPIRKSELDKIDKEWENEYYFSNPFDDFEDEDILITTCSGCGAYSGHYGPHIGCPYDGEFM